MKINETDEAFVKLWKWAVYGEADMCRQFAWALEPDRKFNGMTVRQAVSPREAAPWDEEENMECVDFIFELYELHESAKVSSTKKKGGRL